MPASIHEAVLTDRQRKILAAVEAQGFVTIEGLAESFQVSAQTVRRDIIALDAAGLLQRFHGGAGIGADNTAVRLGHHHKRTIATDAKRTIARRAAAIVPAGASIFLDVGTTIEAAAAVLNRTENLTVFTNSMNAGAMFDAQAHDVHVLGGQLGGGDGSLVGETVVTALAELRLDYALIGCSSIEDGGAVMDFDMRKIAVKKAAMRAARCRCLLAAADKFGRSARAVIAMTRDFDHVVSDQAAMATDRLVG